MQVTASFLDRLKVEIVGCLGAALLWLLFRTLRWKFLGEEAPGALFRRISAPAIFVFWHNRQLALPAAYVVCGGKRGGITALISRHQDGRFIARACQALGIRSVAGSSTRGGAHAIRALVRELRAGRHVAITPDGPRGPRYVAKTGAAALARLARVPVYPIAWAANSTWEFASWDRMLLPRPFARCVLSIGQPVELGNDSASLEDQAAAIGVRLQEVTAAAEQASGLAKG